MRKFIEAMTIKINSQPLEGSPAEAFLDALEEVAGQHPLDPKAFIVADCVIRCQPTDGNAGIYINSMDSMKKGSGAGTAALKTLCRIADDTGAQLSLVALGYGDTPTASLVQWYVRNGFQKTGMGSETDGWRMKRPMGRLKLSADDEPQVIKLQGFDNRRPH